MGLTGDPVGVAQDLQLHVGLNQTAADKEKRSKTPSESRCSQKYPTDDAEFEK